MEEFIHWCTELPFKGKIPLYLINLFETKHFQDADKIIDDMKKKGTSQDVVKITNVASDIFLSVLRFGLRESKLILIVIMK